MRCIINLLITLFLSIIIVDAQAQDFKVKGKITAPDGLGLPGASVVVKGTQIGVVSGMDGSYVITTKRGAVLQFISIGFDNQEITVTKEVIDVVMTESSTALDEVVVTAFGMKRELRTLGYAISSLSSNDITVAGATKNPMEGLYGKVAGVTMRQGASGPTGGMDFKIRAAAGLQSDAKTRPLFVVDGTPIHDEETGLNKDSFGGKDFGTGINDINAEDIESIDILKGAKASVLYGSQGANGVVLITTKSGKNKKGIGITVNLQTTIEQPISYYKFQNQYGPGNTIYDKRDQKEVGGVTYDLPISNPRNFGPQFDPNQELYWWFDGKVRPYISQGTGVNNTMDDVFMTPYSNGYSNQASLAVTSAGEGGNMRIAYTRYNYQGIVKNFTQGKNTFSFSGTLNASKRLRIDVSNNLYFINTKNRMGTATNFVNGISRDHPWKDLEGYYRITDPKDPNYGYKLNLENAGWPEANGFYYLPEFMDMLWEREANNITDAKFHMIASMRPTFNITDELYLVGYAGIDYTNTDFTIENGVTQVYPTIKDGKYEFKKRNTTVQEFRAFLNYEKKFNRLGFHAYAGPIYRQDKDNSMNVATQGNFLYPDWFHIKNQDPSNDQWPSGSAADKVRNASLGVNSMYSALGVATLSWDNSVYLELNGRNDWSSTLPKENNSYFYPGVALTWIMSNYISIPKVEFAKFRASFADVGREAPSRYYAYQFLEAKKLNGTQAQLIESQKELFSGALRPERKREIEVGFAANFFKNSRVGIDLAFYTNNIYDQIMSVPLAHTSGSQEIKINAGNVRNMGYEVQIKGTPILTKNLRWNLTYNTSNSYSKVIKLYPGITYKNITDIGGQIFAQAREGERMGEIYGHTISRTPSGEKIVSPDGSAYVLNDKNLDKIGNIFPDFVGGLLSDLSYKSWSFNMTLDYSFGATLFSWSNYWAMYNGVSEESLTYRDQAHGGVAYYLNQQGNKVRWEHNQSAPKDSRDGKVYHDGVLLPGVQEVKGADGSVTYVNNENISSATAYYNQFARWTTEAMNSESMKFKNDYIKIRELALTYNVPKNVSQKLSMNNLSFSFFARNLWYLYRTLPNLDPESNMASDSYVETSPNPHPRTYGVSISIGF